MSQIKNEIQSLQRQLSALKEGYSKFIDEIKSKFFDREDYFDENSKLKPRDEASKIAAAYCLALRKCPRSRYDLDVSKDKKYKQKKNGHYDFDDYEFINRYTVSDTSFRFRGEEHTRDKPAIVVKLKDIKLLDKICKKIWIDQVANRRVVKGFDEWLEEISIEKLYELIQENNKYVYTINERKLYIKDMVVILQQSPNSILNGYFIDY
jgi:hypothetical protein